MDFLKEYEFLSVFEGKGRIAIRLSWSACLFSGIHKYNRRKFRKWFYVTTMMNWLNVQDWLVYISSLDLDDCTLGGKPPKSILSCYRILKFFSQNSIFPTCNLRVVVRFSLVNIHFNNKTTLQCVFSCCTFHNSSYRLNHIWNRTWGSSHNSIK